MINEKRLAELRAYADVEVDPRSPYPIKEMLDTIEVLWKVARAAEREHKKSFGTDSDCKLCKAFAALNETEVK